MINGHQGPEGKQHVVFPRTQAMNLTEVNQVSLPRIKNLEKGKRINIWSWKRSVQSALIQFKLEDVIDNKVFRPPEDVPNYERWRSWTTVVRCWVLNQLCHDVVEDVEQFCRRIETELTWKIGPHATQTIHTFSSGCHSWQAKNMRDPTLPWLFMRSVECNSTPQKNILRNGERRYSNYKGSIFPSLPTLRSS